MVGSKTQQMATIKVVLDKRRKKSNGTYPLILRITHHSKSRTIPLKVSVEEKDWDETAQAVNKSHRNYKLLNHNIRKRFIDAEIMILKLDEDDSKLSISSIRSKVLGNGKKITVFEFSESLIKQMNESNRIGNASIYQRAVNSLFKFYTKKDLEFTDIDYGFLSKWKLHYSLC